MHKKPHSIQALWVIIVLALTLAACGRQPSAQSNTPTAPTTQAIVGQAATPTQAAPLPTSTLAPTWTPQPTPTPTATPVMPTITPPIPTATASPATPLLAILSFSIDSQDIADGGKRFIYTWTTSGAASVTLYSSAQMRFPKWWSSLPPNGAHTADIAYTYYRNPSMSLTAYDNQGNQVSQSVTVTWPCKHTYFFTPEPSTCPAYEAAYTAAAQESFEKGHMIWLQEIHIGSYEAGKQILVLFNTGDAAYYDDTWTESEPDRDPSIVPPAGLYQPIRGFGKLWRANEQVRNGLGWATDEEKGYQAAIQQQAHETIAGPLYLRASNNQIIVLPSGWPYYSGLGGRWEIYTP